MLSIDGDRRVVDRVADIDFRPGANWAEDSAATNGPGTALAEGKPIEVFASEHFVSKWQPWSCAAAPIRAPGADGPVGVIDITGPWEVQRRQAILVARAIARAVEERLRAAKGVRDEVVRHALLSVRNTGDALIGVDAYGHVLGASDAARRVLTGGGSLPPEVKHALADALHKAAYRAEGNFPVQGSDGSALLVSPVQYEGANVGAILRVLQEKEIVRLGGSSPRRVDDRVIAATNKPLDDEIRARRFRRDLYYRLNVFFISVPPLRERKDDITYLAEVFLREAQSEVRRADLTLSPEAMAALRVHPWPGNVRELKNVLLRAAAVAPRTCIGFEDLALEPGSLGAAGAVAVSLEPGLPTRASASDLEREALVRELETCAWNVARAADRLGISRMTLYRRLHKCGISRNKAAPGEPA